jgi:hypothetical protein
MSDSKKEEEEEDGHAILDRLAAKARPARIREVSRKVVVLPMVLVEMIVDYCTYDERERTVDHNQCSNVYWPQWIRLDQEEDSHAMDLAVDLWTSWQTEIEAYRNETEYMWSIPFSDVELHGYCPLCGVLLRSPVEMQCLSSDSICANDRRPLSQRLTILDFDPGLGRYD